MSFFFYYNVNQKTYTICCQNFLKGCFQILESTNLQKYQGLIVWNGLMKMIAFVVLNILNCKITVLHVKWKLELSLVKITMKFYTCGCLFDYYNYLFYCPGGFFVKKRYQKDDVGKIFTFTFSNRGFLYRPVIHAFFTIQC